jgi:uncharacterized protein (DUF58 family)
MQNPFRWFATTIVGAALVGIVASLATGDWLFLVWALVAFVVVTAAMLAYAALTSASSGPAESDSDLARLRREQERLAELRRR